MMGKKRKNTPQKTKEISVVIAEASSTTGGGEIQINAPRKRGRPRKIVFEEELEEISKSEEEKEEIQTHVPQKEKEEQTSLMAENRESVKEQQPKSKARRKSKPHKSS